MKLTKKEQAEYEKWLAKHELERKKALARLKADTKLFQKKMEQDFWASEAKKDKKILKNQQRSSSFVNDNGTLKPVLHYTGDKVKGIATMHKSSIVPIFSNEEAIDVAKMRRN